MKCTRKVLLVNSLHSGKALQERAQQTEKCHSHTNYVVSRQVNVHFLLLQHQYSVYYFFRFVSLKKCAVNCTSVLFILFFAS